MTIAELLTRQGDIAAAGYRESGRIAGTLAGQLGAIPGQFVAQVQQQKQQKMSDLLTQQQIDSGAALEDERKTATAAKKREAVETERLKALFATGPVTPPVVYSIVGPERGETILKGLAALQDQQGKMFDSSRARIGALAGGILALPEPMRAESYAHVRQQLITERLAKPEQIPETYDPVFVQQAHVSAMTPDAQQGVISPKLVETTAGASLLNPQTGAVVGTAPAAPKPPNWTQPQHGLVDGKPGSVMRDENDPKGTLVDAITKQPIKSFVATPPQSQTPTPDAVLSPNQKKIASDLASGEMTYAQLNTMFPRSDKNSAIKQGIYLAAREMNQNFNPAAFEIGYKFASNPKVKQQMASLKNVQSGVADLLKFSDRADRSGMNILNSLTMPGSVALGSKTFNNFKVARTAFADELSGALGYGSATDMSREMGFDMTDPTMSGANFKSGIEDVVLPFVQRKKASLLGEMGPYGKDSETPPAAPAFKVGDPVVGADGKTVYVTAVRADGQIQTSPTKPKGGG